MRNAAVCAVLALVALSVTVTTRAFFSIWLDPRTREPKRRERLIGAR